SRSNTHRPVVHFQAPPGDRVAGEMETFFGWFEDTGAARRPIVHAAVAHLWFLTIHPFSDGNGRVGRAIADLVLARAYPHVAPYVSLSRQIQRERADYYEAISTAQRGDVDVTAWVRWFLGCYARALQHTRATIDVLLRADAFWRDYAHIALNDRQRSVLQRYLRGDFEGWLSTSKYVKLAKTSPDTAQRDLAALVRHGILVPNPTKGPRTSYRLTAPSDSHGDEPGEEGEA
ncbi:MAG: Fic family protein, partial [Candidatus Eremiobacteraeota bacterium]|nr:Fic family protein [Candidatus Eremiobacteraeota bacterium]